MYHSLWYIYILFVCLLLSLWRILCSAIKNKYIHFEKELSSTKPIDVHMQRYSMAELSENLDNKSASLLIPNLYNMYLTEMEKSRCATAQTCRNTSICFKSKHTCKPQDYQEPGAFFLQFLKVSHFMPACFCLFVCAINFLILSFGMWLYKGQQTERKSSFKAFFVYRVESGL